MSRRDSRGRRRKVKPADATAAAALALVGGRSSSSWMPSWRPPLLITICLYLVVTGGIERATAEGNIGCLFAQSLCNDHVEMCYDDYAFGKCVPIFESDFEDLQRSRLTMEQSQVLATMLQEMQGAGLTWDHPFVQCRMQGALFALRERTLMPPNLCGHLAPPPEILGPQSPMAYVRFTPPEDDYLDAVEEFYPPSKKSLSERIYPDPAKGYDELELLEQLANSEPERIPVPIGGPQLDALLSKNAERYNLERLLREAEANAQIEENPILPYLVEDSYFTERQRKLLEADALDSALNAALDQLAKIGNGEQVKRKDWDVGQAEEPEQEEVEKPHTSFREVARVEHIPAVSYYRDPHPVFEDSDWERENPNGYGGPITSVRKPNDDIPEESVVPAESGGIYTEGGVVYLPGQAKNQGDMDEEESREEARSLLANMLGFTRHERLDVKKPGPPAAPPPPSATVTEPQKPIVMNKEVLPANLFDTPKSKKLVIEGHSSDDHGVHSVDSQYAHVKFTTPVDNWRDGERIVQAIAEQVGLPNSFTHIRVDEHEVSFRVDANPEKKTAMDVAKAINDSRFKNSLSRRLGVNVLSAGIGDKTKATEWHETMAEKMTGLRQDGGIDSTHLMVYMFVGAGAAAILVAVITLFLMKRHDKVKSKLGNLQSGGGASIDSKGDYQELCRARMAGKGSDSVTSGRITSLTKENERPPSSRSSTSSWSEEPMTNMDISTGHMVLSYMEDHLRNKGRLQREWEALCRYEAEPNSRDAGLQDQCEKFNRDGAPLPFDHSRVVLNHLANAEGLDYINASTITDHDPRAPAYVAAQGPMESTVAHFWQMIWEQGTVVIVALCRLQENGEISCTRYWPEEGAATYNIYEVHLVSEHIWCDDYLVRSFYLKNLQTGETRTVTQFHFLTWPQMGVPASAKPLLEFRRKVNKSYRGRSCPIVVHSGNGAGRTGAYILLDLVLGRMNKGAREIDIAATLEHLRDQRQGLVETRGQFEFVLMAVAEEVHAILKALPNTTSTEKRDIEKDPIKEDEKKGEAKGKGVEEKKATEEPKKVAVAAEEKAKGKK